jgi:hypothetical protein
MKARRQTEEGQNENAAMSQSARRTRSAGQVEQERERLASRWKNQSQRTQDRERENNTAVRGSRRTDRELGDREEATTLQDGDVSDRERQADRASRSVTRQVSGRRRDGERRRPSRNEQEDTKRLAPFKALQA